MLQLVPKQIPSLSMMLDDLGNPSAAKLAKALGVCRRTVGRWVADDEAPRAAMLAIFWMTSWGISTIHCEAHNAASQTAVLVAALKRANADLQAKLDSLANSGSTRCPDCPRGATNGQVAIERGAAHQSVAAAMTRRVRSLSRTKHFG
ncbi:hypothetical protein [Roseateles sp.]|uniref:hypothetical protein n=1 Tax=Roseateles sp. TaxID=1971397 RepID=UPI003BA7E433